MQQPDIYLCDDDVEFMAELSLFLHKRGYEVHALRAVAELPELTRPCALLLDLCMPGQDGIEALRVLSKHPQRELLNVMFVSGWNEAMVGQAVKLAELRGLRVLPSCRKPLALGQLCEILAVVK